MTTALGSGPTERFRAAATGALGVELADVAAATLAALLARRLAAGRQSADAYLRALERGGPDDELTALAAELVVPETYFFRHGAQLQAFTTDVVPALLPGRDGGLRILSAGCASGEEPYSLAMVLEDHLGAGHRTSIRGFDINGVVLDRARRGRYSPWSLRETPPRAQLKWFTPEGSGVLLAERIRAAVTFERHNLVHDGPGVLEPGSFDVIFCRNVLMYLRVDVMRSLVDRFARALTPGGYLFLGHAESLRGLSGDYDSCDSQGSFYYRKPARERTTAVGPPPAPPTVVLPKPAPPAARLVVPGGPAGGAREADWDLPAAMDLLRRERYSQALGLVTTFPREADRDPRVLLLHATLLVQVGDLDRAERVCRRLLDVDASSAAGHYVLALCREGWGDVAGASEQDRIAIDLDPAFAMPHLHLGLMARRGGDLGIADRACGRARQLLHREDPDRIALFGGGFGRDALMSLCRERTPDLEVSR